MLGVWYSGACDSIDLITTVLRTQAQILRESRGVNRKLMGSLKRVVDDLYRLFYQHRSWKGYSVRLRMSKEYSHRVLVFDTYSTVVPACEGNIHQHYHPTSAPFSVSISHVSVTKCQPIKGTQLE